MFQISHVKMNTTNVSDIAGKNEHNKNVLDIPVKSKHNTQNVSWHPPLSVDSSVGLDLVFIRSGPFLSDPAFLSDPGLFFAEIRAPLVAVITNSGERAKSTTENKSTSPSTGITREQYSTFRKHLQVASKNVPNSVTFRAS